MRDAKERFSSRGEEVIGCAMFSCSAHGPLPSSSFFDTESLDANTYCQVFPRAPLLGSYCNGEIGPKAMAELSAETIFRTGNATVRWRKFTIATTYMHTVHISILSIAFIQEIVGAASRPISYLNMCMYVCMYICMYVR